MFALKQRPETSDPDLIAAVLDGSEAAFGALVDRYQDRVFRLLGRYCRDAVEREDLAQEVFLKVFRKLHTFKQDSQFFTWVYRIAVNASIDLKRKAANRRLPSLDQMTQVRGEESPSLEPVDERAVSPVESAATEELELEVQAAITRLSPKMRGITVLRYMQGLSYEEISLSLGISLGTVKSRLARAHQALDRELTPLLDRHGLR